MGNKPLTQKEKGARQMLVVNYNKAKTLKTKKSRYADLMVFEKKMADEEKNG